MHVLVLHAMLSVRHPAPFKLFGQWQVPELLGQVLHWIARLAKVLMIIFTLLFLFLRGFTSTGPWRLVQMLFILVIGLVGVPSIFPKLQHWTASLTKGAAVGSTGASIGVLLTLGVILALTIFSTIIRNPSQSGEV